MKHSQEAYVFDPPRKSVFNDSTLMPTANKPWCEISGPNYICTRPAYHSGAHECSPPALQDKECSMLAFWYTSSS